MEWCYRAKKIVSQIDCELLLHANFTKLIGSLCWTKNVDFYSSKHILAKFYFERIALMSVI